MGILKLLYDSYVRYPGKVALYDTDNNKSYTYKDLLQKVNFYADFFIQNGIKKGDRTALYLKNSIDYIIIFFSILKIRAIPVLVDYQYTTYEVDECLKLSNSVHLIFHQDKFENISKNIKNINLILSGDIDNSQQNKETELLPVETGNSDETTKIILFTYRGYGRSLPVLLDEQAVINAVYKNNERTEIDSSLRISLFLPLCHIFSFTCNLMSPLSVGGTIFITNNLKPIKILKVFSEYKINFVILVPVLVKILIHSLKKKNMKLPYLKRGIVGGNRFTKDLFDEFNRLTGCVLLQGYGLTETSPVICNQWDNNKPDSIGTTMSGVEAKIVDNMGNEVADFEEGKLLIKTDSLMDCYLNLKEITDKIVNNGWFDTGDIVYKDNDNFYYFIRREKNIAKIGGTNVDIVEVLNVLQKYPDVTDVKLNIVKDNLWSDKISCDIEAVKEITKLELVEYCRNYLSATKIPKEFNISTKTIL